MDLLLDAAAVILRGCPDLFHAVVCVCGVCASESLREVGYQLQSVGQHGGIHEVPLIRRTAQLLAGMEVLLLSGPMG